MSKQLSFNQVKKAHLKTLKQYVPVVAKVHGGTHPEFHEVKKLFDAIELKMKEAESNKPELEEEFTKLRAVTNDYTVPGDVCESFEAVYNMLADMDKAYHL